MDSTSPEFWSTRYKKGKTPWDLHGIPTALNKFLASCPVKGRVLIPGCGSGYEVRAFNEAGWDVTAIDFCPEAVQRAKKILGSLGNHVILGDFFKYEFKHQFDLIYERTFLCSFSPQQWTLYAYRIAELLHSGGKLVGIFLYGTEDEPPPYPLTDKVAHQLFDSSFVLDKDKPILDSLPIFEGKERWQEWMKK